jgi:alkylation response protein AidB-like acyl-CoA dehydrogenase
MTVDRTELRAWLEANCPPEMREPPSEDDICWGGRRFMFRSEAQKLWLERCIARGLTVPTWPKEYGGAGFAGEDAAILKEAAFSRRTREAVVLDSCAVDGCDGVDLRAAGATPF